jgi:hypothetical protein
MADNLQLFKELTKQFTLDPLEADDPRYVQLRPAGESAVDALRTDLELAERARVLLVAGARGAGKSTEFNRLKVELEASGQYRVAIVDALAYLNGSQPLDIHKLLLILVARTVEVFVNEINDDTHPTTKARLLGLLKRLKIGIKVAGAEFNVSSEGVTAGFAGQSMTIDLSGGTQEVQSNLLDQVRTETADLHGFVEDVRGFFQDLRRDLGKDLVVIVDSLDKFRGTRETDVEIQRSIATLFVQYREQLGFPSHHMIYTIPAHINSTDPSVAAAYDGAIRFVPVVKLFEQGDKDETAPVAKSIRLMTEVATARRTEHGGNVLNLFGTENDHLQRVIIASGGQLRDLFRVLREIVAIAHRRRVALPVPTLVVDEAIAAIQRDFADLYAEDIELVSKVREANGVPDVTEEELPRLGRLLEAHVLLAHQNGVIWFAVHPLAQQAISERKRQQGLTDGV